MRLRQRSRRASASVWLRCCVPMTALFLIGCAASDPTVTGSIPSAGIKTVAFESIDGPPRPVFDRLVAALSSEAERRELPVVSHTGPSVYRVRAYLVTLVEKKRKEARLSWVWEVFDSAQNRSFRLTGEESLGAPRSDVWGQCDDALLSRVAAKGFDELVARIELLPVRPLPAGSAGPALVAAEAARATAFSDTKH